MEAYKQEFIHFMVDSDVLKFGDFTLKERQKVPVLYERGRLCDRLPVKEAGRVLCQGDPCEIRRRF